MRVHGLLEAELKMIDPELVVETFLPESSSFQPGGVDAGAYKTPTMAKWARKTTWVGALI